MKEGEAVQKIDEATTKYVSEYQYAPFGTKSG